MSESVVWGAWGDVIAALGHVIEQGREEGEIVYWGLCDQIPEFIRAQDRFGPVRHVKPASFREMHYVIWHQANTPGYAWQEALGVSGDAWCALGGDTNAHVPHYWEPVVPGACLEWAGRVRESIAHERVMLVQPRSDQSCPWGYHWRHWLEAVEGLLRRGERVVLVGQGWQWLQPHRHLRNMIDEVPSMMHVYALSEVCEAVATTSNSLSLWMRARGLPGTVCPTAAFDDPRNYFRRWVEGGVPKVLGWRSGLGELWESLYDSNRSA